MRFCFFPCETKSSREFEDFNIFYHRFNSDSIFQLERITFPPPAIHTEEMSVIDSIYYWKKEDWKFESWNEVDAIQFGYKIGIQEDLVIEEETSKENQGLILRRMFELKKKKLKQQ